jgi:7,8-dihydropterin-6-yl-methyl-4-(beta-D-ribofuranosyl)aminobenzene 5'-phosphate synthase
MKIKILFDKEGLGPQYHAGWGLSFLVDDSVLFDTGEKFEYLKNNAKLMGVDLGKIRTVVISHDHWDHIGGLWGLLNLNKNITVYGCALSNKEIKKKVKELGGIWKDVDAVVNIDNGIYSTGQIVFHYKNQMLAEQAMVIERKEKLILLCGCVHPNIVTLIEKVKAEFNKEISLILGGLHLMDKEQRVIEYVVSTIRAQGIRGIGASHCTGYEATQLLKKVFADNFVEIKVGEVIEC